LVLGSIRVGLIIFLDFFFDFLVLEA